jgi:hypothetical protein
MLVQLSRRVLARFGSCKPLLPEYNASADFKWIQYQSRLPWLELSVQIPVDQIQAELTSVAPYLVDHRDDYGEHCGWKSFCIHGKSYDSTREDQYYQDSRPYTWTVEAEKNMPDTVKFFREQWPGHGYGRIRLMCLEPGGYITLHSDYQNSALQPINISITQPDQCRFVMENHGVIPFVPGSTFWLDISNRHLVFNDSEHRRWHIIVHQNCDHPIFKKIVVKSYHDLYNAKDAHCKTDNT